MLRSLDLSGLTAARLRVLDAAVEGGMAEAFPVSGNIDPTAFPHLLVDLHRHGATGSLKVSGPTHPKAMFFRGGRILFGSSNDPKDQLGSILLESGRITRQQLDEVSAKVGPGRPLAKVLAESGFVNQRELGDAARVKLERILADVLSWHSGSFEFEDGVLPKGAVDLKLPTAKLLLSAVRRIGDRGFALRHVALEAVLEPQTGNEAEHAEIQAEVQPLLEKLDGRRTLSEAIALTRLDEFDAAKTACALLFLGIVRVRPEPVEVDLAQEAQSAFATPEPDAEPDPGEMTMRLPLTPEEARSFIMPETEPTAFAFAPPRPEPPAAPQAPALPSFIEAEPLHVEPADEEPIIVAEAAPELAPDAPTYVLPQSPVADVPLPPPAPPEPQPELELPSTRILRPEPPPEPEPEPTVRRPPEPSRPARSTRPSQEDLAALDALLNPSTAAAPAAAPPPRPPQERSLAWAAEEAEPTDSGPAAPPLLRGTPRSPGRRGARVDGGSSASTRLLLVLVALAGVVLATVAAWYFLLRRPSSSSSATLPSPAPATITTTTTAPLPPAQTPAPGAQAQTPAVAAAGGAATPPATAAPVTRPGPPSISGAAATASEARTLLARGSLAEAARAFAGALQPGASSRFTVQLLTACSPETVQKAVSGTAGAEELFVLPVSLQGRSCYRLCWGVYESRAAAEAAAPPPYFRQGGARPRISGLAELLP